MTHRYLPIAAYLGDLWDIQSYWCERINSTRAGGFRLCSCGFNRRYLRIHAGYYRFCSIGAGDSNRAYTTKVRLRGLNSTLLDIPGFVGFHQEPTFLPPATKLPKSPSIF
ncbi:hypothetical protein [Merismopedia glauca]|uniref:hypothetical protein n=1 Tax=Merismopedia glauca TaxID=292586 RepID=UPI0011B1E218